MLLAVALQVVGVLFVVAGAFLLAGPGAAIAVGGAALFAAGVDAEHARKGR